MISHLEFVKMVISLILSLGLIEMLKFFIEKMKKEKLGLYA